MTPLSPKCRVSLRAAWRISAVTVSDSSAGRSRGWMLPHHPNPELPNAARPMSCSLRPRMRQSRPSATNATDAGSPSTSDCSTWSASSGFPSQRQMPCPPPLRTRLRSQRPATAPASSPCSRVTGCAMPDLLADASQQRPVPHLAEYLRRVAEHLELAAEPRHDLDMILEVGAVRHRVGADAPRRLPQPRGGQRQAEIAPQRVALGHQSLVSVGEEVDGDDIVAAADGGHGHGARTHGEHEGAHYPASSLALSMMPSASRTRSLRSNRRAMERLCTFILRSPIPSAP